MLRILTTALLLSFATAAVAKPEEVKFVAADGVQVFADMYRSDAGMMAPIILLFHQAGSDARGEYTGIANRLIDNGYNVIAVDQRSGGDRFGGVNRTMANAVRQDYDYCDAYPDLDAALQYARAAGFDGNLAVWGSSYSAALVFQLGAKNADEVDAVLGFSPAAGEPLADCALAPYLKDLAMPALALRPQGEFELESVQAQMLDFAAHDVQTYVANPGVHGSSMLNAERVGESTEAAWTVVLKFLDTSLRPD
jgi:pimeloyl-ACP methyl ester carboxylesterase